jgi:hypothetical protein
LSTLVHRVLDGEIRPKDAVELVMSRQLRAENE